MSIALPTMLAILAMALATYITRIAGILLVSRFILSKRVTKALDAIPGAILMAVIAPMVLATGPAEFVAAGIAAIASTRLPLLAVAGVGVVVVVLLRSFIG